MSERIVSNLVSLVGNRDSVVKLKNILGNSLQATENTESLGKGPFSIDIYYNQYDWMELERVIGSGNIHAFTQPKVPQIILSTI